jgi:hypothetical protein
MEVEVGIGALLDRFPHLALAVAKEELQWRNSFRNRGLRTAAYPPSQPANGPLTGPAPSVGA